MRQLCLFTLFLFVTHLSLAQQNVRNNSRPFEKLENGLLNVESKDKFLKITDVSIYGAGGILGVATGKNDSVTTTSATGSLGLNILTERIATNIYFSLNGQKEVEINTLEQLGVSLLNNNLTGNAFSIASYIRLHKFFGASLSLTTVNNNWETDSIKHNASPVILKGGIVFIPFDTQSIENFDFRINLHYTLRKVLGDISNIDDGILIIDDNEFDLNKSYHGFDASFNVILNSLEIYTLFSYNYEGTNIPGFSGWQVSIGLNISADAVKIKKN